MEIHPKAGKMRAFHSVFFYFMKPIKDLEKIRSAVFENGCCCSEPTTWNLNLSKIIKQEQSRHRVGIFRLSIQHSGEKKCISEHLHETQTTMTAVINIFGNETSVTATFIGTGSPALSEDKSTASLIFQIIR